jgi:hypothetical protein
MHSRHQLECVLHGLRGSASTLPTRSLDLLLFPSICGREPTSSRQGRAFGVQNEVAAAFDQHRYGHRLQSTAVFERLEFVELEDSDQPVTPRPFEHRSMELAAVRSEEVQSLGDRLARSSQVPRALTQRGLRNEILEQRQMERRLSKAVVESKGLS